MSLTRPKMTEIIHKQVRFKLNSNAISFSILAFLQVFALFLSLPSTSSFDHGNEISIIEISTATHIAFAMFWAFFSGINLGSAAKWNESFTFVTTRLTHHLSSLLYIMIASFFASVMTSFAGPALRLITYMRYKEISQSTMTITEAPMNFLIQIVTAFAYLLVVFVLGYAIQSFFQPNRLIAGIYLVGIGALFIIINIILGIPIVSTITFSFIHETSLWLFLLKVFGTVSLLMGFSIWMTNRLEVRKS